MRYKIVSKHDVPEELVMMGCVRTLVIECESAHFPLADDIDRGGAVAHFNGFPFELHPGDRVESLDNR